MKDFVGRPLPFTLKHFEGLINKWAGIQFNVKLNNTTESLKSTIIMVSACLILWYDSKRTCLRYLHPF